MKRWNGWGDESVTATLPPAAVDFLRERLGEGIRGRDASLEETCRSVPPARLDGIPGLNVSADARLRHARGQSLPDWIALRGGSVRSFPDAVAFPESAQDVRTLLLTAHRNGWQLIPYGGGTSVAGHINPEQSERPVLTVSLERMNRMLSFDDMSQLATFQAGVLGPELEARLRSLGYTLGHYPQSFEHSSLGGWVATRSSGQQSLGFGRIEKMFAGGSIETPAGTLNLPCFPASAAGPDLKELVLGSEGRMGIITESTVRVSRIPEREDFHAIFFPSWQPAVSALREILQTRLPLSMLRLSTPEETRTSLILAGHERLIRTLEGVLALRGARTEKCLLLVGLTGRERVVVAAKKELLSITRPQGGIHIGRAFGNAFKKNRFRAPYLRNDLWDKGYAIDTLETAAPWSRIPSLLQSIETGIRDGLASQNERVHVFTHLSHPYTDGSSIYTTYAFRLAPSPEETLARWTVLKGNASRAIVAGGGTISHQHGVGTDHKPYLAAEKGRLGVDILNKVLAVCDPSALMNPGKLITKEPMP